MALEIADTTMTAPLNGDVIATATRTGHGWHVTTWPIPIDRNAAITALSLTERLLTHDEDDPCVIESRKEPPLAERLVRSQRRSPWGSVHHDLVPRHLPIHCEPRLPQSHFPAGSYAERLRTN